MGFETIEWKNGQVVMIDQRVLPREEKYLSFTTAEEVAQAIEQMVIRGAPAIGVAAAMGIALGAHELAQLPPKSFFRGFYLVCERMSKTRPTAVNLFWAIERMKRLVEEHSSDSPGKIADLYLTISGGQTTSIRREKWPGRGAGALSGRSRTRKGFSCPPSTVNREPLRRLTIVRSPSIIEREGGGEPIELGAVGWNRSTRNRRSRTRWNI